MEWLWVPLIGLLVGVVELVARYRDNPGRALRTAPAVFYMAINAIACLLCLTILVRVRPSWIFAGQDTGLQQLYLILAAGFGAVAIFRSSIFKLKSADGEIAVGPAIVLDTLLAASDRGVDRQVAAPRSAKVNELMKDVSFDRAKVALPTYCFALMQNVGASEQKAIADQANALSETPMADQLRTLNLGLALLNVVGEHVLSSAVKDLGTLIARDPPIEQRDVGKIADLMARVDFDKARLSLPIYCFSLAGTVAPDVQAAFAKQIESIGASPLPAAIRSLTLGLGLGLAQLVGLDVLKFAVEHLADAISLPPAAHPA